jgi:hypothetical protein
MVAVLMHLWVMPGHFEEWWAYGAFFLAAALLQTGYTFAIPRFARHRLFLLFGIVGNLSTIAMCLRQSLYELR